MAEKSKPNAELRQLEEILEHEKLAMFFLHHVTEEECRQQLQKSTCIIKKYNACAKTCRITDEQWHLAIVRRARSIKKKSHRNVGFRIRGRLYPPSQKRMQRK